MRSEAIEREAAMVGNQPAFGSSIDQGVTYQEWLIGQALVGLSMRDDLTPCQKARIAYETAESTLTTIAGRRQAKDTQPAGTEAPF